MAIFEVQLVILNVLPRLGQQDFAALTCKFSLKGLNQRIDVSAVGKFLFNTGVVAFQPVVRQTSN
jgi:hypothetical protein